MGEIFGNFLGFLLFAIAMLFAICVILFAFGWIMRHWVKPIHNKIWRHKEKKKTSLAELFHEGVFLFILTYWVPFILLLTFGSLYFAITSAIEKNMFKTILSLLFSVFFGFKLWFMFEHKEHAKKRWSRKGKSMVKKKIKKKSKKKK